MTSPEDSGAERRTSGATLLEDHMDDGLKGQLEENVFSGKIVGSPDLNQLTGPGQGARQF